jgi:3-phosphoshikimate 1-carboxyvinyltransferase
VTRDFISTPVEALQGDIAVPGDKSISHRAIMLGAIAQGMTTVHGFLPGEDCLATLRAFQAMGVRIERPGPHEVVIHGVGKHDLQKPRTTLDCGNSGTSIRLLTGLLAAQSFDTELTGDESLVKRPMERIRKPLLEMGADVTTRQGCPPLLIRGGKKLRGITYEMPQASAQVKSCLLLAGLYASGETRVIEPVLTRDHTERMLASFSCPVRKTENNVLVIHAGSECKGTDIAVPGDLSSAAFLIVAATLIPHSELLIRDVGINPTRTGILHILKRMGANITVDNKRQWGEEPVADLHIRHARLHGIVIPEFIVPSAIDEFPVLFIAAACAEGQTVLQGARELRCKESDRIGAMAAGLNNLGIEAHALDDGIVIQGGVFQGGTVDSWHDHRIAMAFAIAGAVSKSPVTIRNCDSVATSFPDFVTLANQINLSIRVIENEA